MHEDVALRVLGPVVVERGGQTIGLGSPQVRAVLVALLFRHGRTVSTAQLVDAVWGERPPQAAVRAIRTYVSRLRKVLDPEHVAREPSSLLPAVAGGYVLHWRAEAVDLMWFRRLSADAEAARQRGAAVEAMDQLRRGLALWRGGPLAGVPGPFAEMQRARLVETWLSANESRIELEFELGEHRSAIPDLTAMCYEHPFRERPRELLMRALRTVGRQADALAVFADIRRLLLDEFGVEPGRQLRDLHLQILRADTAVGASAGAVARADLPPGAGSRDFP